MGCQVGWNSPCPSFLFSFPSLHLLAFLLEQSHDSSQSTILANATQRISLGGSGEAGQGLAQIVSRSWGCPSEMPLCFSEMQACCGAGTGPLSKASVGTDEPKSQAHVLSPALLPRLRQVPPAASPESDPTKHPPGWGWGDGSQGCDNSGTLTSASTSQAAAVSVIEGFKGSSLSITEDGHRGGLQSLWLSLGICSGGLCLPCPPAHGSGTTATRTRAHPCALPTYCRPPPCPP